MDTASRAILAWHLPLTTVASLHGSESGYRVRRAWAIISLESIPPVIGTCHPCMAMTPGVAALAPPDTSEKGPAVWL